MKAVLRIISAMSVLAAMSISTFADVTVKQRVTMTGMKMESTRMIKGARERTESKAEMGDPAASAMFPQVSTITQCDLKRKVQISDRKRLYFVEPMVTTSEPAASRPLPPEPQPAGQPRQGGTVTMTFNARDTGERKMVFGLQARHIITTQEMVSSADSCNGANQTKMEYDGWYVDFSADFSCPIKIPQQRPEVIQSRRPDCTDRIITKGSGITDPGFLIEGTMKMYGRDGTVQMTQTTETLELSRTPLDQALFEIPSGYVETRNSQDLYAISQSDMANAARSRDDNSRPARDDNRGAVRRDSPSRPTSKSVAVNLVLAPGTQSNQAEIEQYVRNKIAGRGLRATTDAGDYNLKIDFRQIKESTGSKVGGLFGKVTGVNTSGAGSVSIDLTATLSNGKEAKVKNKFDGPLSNAIRAALDEVLDQLLANLN
jgi:hypothetical protein